MALEPEGPVARLMLLLARRFDLRHFVETGTFEGGTAAWAAGHFEKVCTIERSEALHQAARERHAALENVHFVQGDSRAALETVVRSLDGPALFWLDAHFSGGETAGADAECPLLDELATIDAGDHQAYLFIDDARLFLAPPPRPHRLEQWPALDQVVFALKARREDDYLVVLDDAFVRVPGEARAEVATFCQELATERWRERRLPPAASLAETVEARLRSLGERFRGR
jgi:hypothetical protein